MRSTRPLQIALGLAFAMIPAFAGAVSVRYQTVTVAYELKPRTAIPTDARTYSVEGIEGLSLPADKIVLGGFTPVPSSGHVLVRLEASPPRVGTPAYSSFTSNVHNVLDNKTVPPVYEVTTYWAGLPIAQSAKLIVSAGGLGREFDAGVKSTIDVGPRPETKSGIIQMSTNRWTLLAQEPCATPEATVERVKWIAEQMCTDVRTLAGPPFLETSKGRARLRAKVDEASAGAAGLMVEPLVQRTNALLEQEIARGERTAQIPFAAIKDDQRFALPLEAIAGPAPDRFGTAATALRAVADDASAKPRVRAAALYDLAICQFGTRDHEAALATLALARETNAKEGDGMFGSSGKDLTKKVNEFEPFLQELAARDRAEPVPLVAPVAPTAAAAPAAPAVAAPAPPAVSTAPLAPASPLGAAPTAGVPDAAPAVAKPWTEMSDDEFMAAYPGLIQGALGRHDAAEMQGLGRRMAEVMSRRSGKR